MKKQTSGKTGRGRSQDRKLVSKQEHELRYEADKMNTSVEAVKRSKSGGIRSREELERKLK